MSRAFTHFATYIVLISIYKLSIFFAIYHLDNFIFTAKRWAITQK